MKVGFTGTQVGMSKYQIDAVADYLAELTKRGEGDEAHHGKCIGADVQFHNLAHQLGYFIVGYPCNIYSKQSQVIVCDMEREEKPPLERNKDIVGTCDILLATPKEYHEITRSGTWSTIRFARRIGRKHMIILPDGTLLQ